MGPFIVPIRSEYVLSSHPLSISQILIVLSSLPDAAKLSVSEENLQLLTQFACPIKEHLNFLCGNVHTLTDLSSEQVNNKDLFSFILQRCGTRLKSTHRTGAL